MDLTHRLKTMGESLYLSINTGIACIPVRLKIAVFCLPDHSLENENSAYNSFV